jgi:hypothetical protein
MIRHGRVECREYEGEMGKWLVIIQCSNCLEIVQENGGAGVRWVWQWDEWKKAFKAFYAFKRKP